MADEPNKEKDELEPELEQWLDDKEKNGYGPSGGVSPALGASRRAAQQEAKDKKGSGAPGGGGDGGNRLQNFAKALSGNRKAQFALISSGGIIGLILIAFFTFLPFKLEMLFKNILEKRVTDKVEYMVEKRADKLVVRYLFERAGLSTGDAVYTDPSIVKTMYGNWRIGKFEQKFTERSGYRIEGVLDGKGRTRGLRLVAPDGTDATFSNADDMSRYLDKGDLKGKEGRRFIRDVTRKNTMWFQVIKRRNIRRYMKNAYGVRIWDYFSNKKDDPATKEDEVQQDVTGKDIDRSIGDDSPYQRELGSVMNCALGETNDCLSDQGDKDEPYGKQTTTAASPTNGSDDETKSRTKDGIKRAAEGAKKLSPRALANKGLTKLLSKAMDEAVAEGIAKKFTGVLGPIMMVDQLARLDHFFGSGQADTTLRAWHKLQYADQFADVATKADNFKDPDHKMSGAEVNAVMTSLQGYEGSCAFNDLVLHQNKGKCKGIDPGLGIDDSSSKIKDDYHGWADYVPIVYPIRAWYHLVDETGLHHIIDLINAGAAFVTKPLTDLIPQNVRDGAGSLLSRMLLFIIHPIDTSSGEDKANAADAGGAVVGQDYAHALGGHEMSATASLDLQRSIALSKEFDQAPKSFTGKLFSPDYQNSLTYRIAANGPDSPSSTLRGMASFAMAVIGSPFKYFGGHLAALSFPAYAASDPYHLKNYGCTDAELDQSLAKSAPALVAAAAAAAARTGGDPNTISPNDIEPKDVPDVPAGECNLGRLDLSAIQVMNPNFTKDDDGGLGEGGSDCSVSASGGGPASGSIYVLGDSIILGAKASGLKHALSELGYEDVFIDGSTSRSITRGGQDGNRLSGLAAVAHDQQAIKDAGTVVINLGANQDTNFKDAARRLVEKVHNINPDAKIFWVNVVSKSDPKAYAAENTALDELSGGNPGFTVIDAAHDNVELQKDGPQPLVHPTPDGYKTYIKSIAGGLGNNQDVGSSECGVTSTGGLPDGDAKALAQAILDDKQIVLFPPAQSDIQSTAKTGGPIDKKLLQLILGASKAGFHVHIYVMKSSHSPGSLHALGRAMDVVGVNNTAVSSYSIPMTGDVKGLYDFMTTNNKTGEYGCPNQNFVDYVTSKGAGGDAFIDPGSGPHLHFGVNK